MELRAKPRLTTTEGLWRKATKAKPGMMTSYIEQRGLLPKEEIEKIRDAVWTEIVDFQQGYAQAKEAGTVDQFLENAENDYRHPRYLAINPR
jgi:hypothetical protein